MNHWVPIVGYESEYEISINGKIKSIGRNGNGYRDRIMNYSMDSYGYLVVGLSKNNKMKTHKVHRLIATHFIPNPENKPQVNHIDGHKLNNKIDNLEWVTAKENINHCRELGLQKTNHEQLEALHNSNKKAILQLDLDNNIIKKWNSIKEAGLGVGIATSNIVAVAKGRNKTAKGFKWRYENDIK